MKRSHPVRAACAALAVAAMLSACGRDKPPPATSMPEVGVVAVSASPATIRSELPGRVSASLVAEVRPQVGGIVQKRLFTEGSRVKAGDVLYQIDAASYQAAYDNARGALAKSEATVESARLKARRYRELLDIKGVSQQDYDDARATLKSGEAEVIANRAALESARIDLARTRITAPISGRIGKSNVTAGALVTASQTDALATIQQLDPVYVDITQSSADLLRLRARMADGSLRRAEDGGTPVQLKLEDGSTYALAGKLRFTDVTVEQTTGTVTLRAEFPNPDHQLLPGMYVRAVIEEGVDAAAIRVPQKAVSRDAKGNATVMVLGADSRVQTRRIRADHAAGSDWLVSEGLESGERVVVDGLQQIRDGMQVRAAGAQPAPSTAKAIAQGSAQPAVQVR